MLAKWVGNENEKKNNYSICILLSIYGRIKLKQKNKILKWQIHHVISYWSKSKQIYIYVFI